jgi:hypothetical protein
MQIIENSMESNWNHGHCWHVLQFSSILHNVLFERELETRCYIIKIIKQKRLVYSFIDRHDITEISLKVVLNTINLQFHIYTIRENPVH